MDVPLKRLSNKNQFTIQNILPSLDYHGYCILENFLSNDNLSRLKNDMSRLLKTTPFGRNRFEGAKTQRCYSLFQKTRELDELVVNPLILEILEEIFGTEHCLLSSTVAINIGTNEGLQVPHRDDGKYPVPRVPNSPELVMNMIVAVDSFTKENGGTVLYEGSHHWQFEGENKYATTNVLENTHEKIQSGINGVDGGSDINVIKQLKTAKPINCEMPAGSIMLYRGSLLHGGGKNQSNAPRCGILIEFIQAWLRPQETHLLAVDRKIVSTLPIKLQEMLGWTVTPPFIGYVDGRHPKILLRMSSKL